MRTGTILVISGPAGSGKDTVTDILTRRTLFRRFPTYTTREPRSGEIDGVHYRFVTREQFEELWRAGKLIDRAGTHDLYGCPKDGLLEAIGRGDDVILHLVFDSARKLAEVVPDAVTVFLLPPDSSESTRRMRERGMTDAEMTRRLQNDPTTPSAVNWYDLVLTNETDRQEETAGMILSYLEARGHA